MVYKITKFQKLLTNRNIIVICIILATIFLSFYLAHLNNQRKLSHCKYLYEQGILSTSSQAEVVKLKEMKNNGVSKTEIDNYWRLLDTETKENVRNIVNMVGKEGDINKVALNCRNFLINP